DDASCGMTRLDFVDHRSRNDLEIRRLAVERDATAQATAREIENVANQRRHAERASVDSFCGPPGCVLIVGYLRQQAGSVHDRGQRSSEIMRQDSDVGVLLAQEGVRFHESLVLLRKKHRASLELNPLL